MGNEERRDKSEIRETNQTSAVWGKRRWCPGLEWSQWTWRAVAGFDIYTLQGEMTGFADESGWIWWEGRREGNQGSCPGVSVC